ncbi:DUF3010 domain-containing protein, partial [Pseudoalteromonas sp. S2755]
MRTLGLEISVSESLLFMLTKEDDVFDIRDIRQRRLNLIYKGTELGDFRKLLLVVEYLV